MKKYYIYIYYRLDINEPFYIGKGKDRRWKDIWKRNKHFKNIANKHSIICEIVKDNLTESEAFYWEEEIIRILVFEYGYSIDIPNNRSSEKGRHLVNQTWGGEGCSGHNPYENKTDEELENWNNKKQQKRKKTWDSKSEDDKNKWREKLSKNNAWKGKKSPFYGKHHTEENKKKMSEAKKGKYKGVNSSCSKKIICLNTLKIFDSISDVNRDEEYRGYNCISSRISKVCSNKTIKGYEVLSSGELCDGTRLTWMYLDDYEKASKEEVEIKIKKAQGYHNGKCIICLNTLIVYKNMNLASKLTNVDRASISKCCDHIRKSAGKSEDGEKLVWMYLNEFLNKCIFIIL